MAIASKVIKTISENTKDDKTWGMWIIQYYNPDDGKTFSIKVICGEKKIRADGEIWYVAKGMSVKDFATLKPVYAEFAKMSANPPAIVSAQADPTQGDIEEVPF